MTITTSTARVAQTLDSQILSVCREYVEAHGNDYGASDYYRLQGDLQDILGADPSMCPVDELMDALNLATAVHDNDRVPGLYPMGSPERGASVAAFMDRNNEDIRTALGAITWKANR